jgi:hypothetical protein
VDSVEFREVVEELDPLYTLPHRKKLNNDIEKMYNSLKFTLASTLDNAHRICFCTNIWTKAGMSASFLGVIAHFFTPNDRKRHHITLAVQRFESPHTAARVAEVLHNVVSTRWSTPGNKIFRVLTDNGSNMIAAFKPEIQHQLVSENEVAIINNEEDDELISDTIDDDDDDVQQTMNFQIAEIDKAETEHRHSFTGWVRISCFIHTLQTVVKIFEVTPAYKAAIKAADRLVKKFCMSSKGTEMLIDRAEKKLVKDCPTRWDSTYLINAYKID